MKTLFSIHQSRTSDLENMISVVQDAFAKAPHSDGNEGQLVKKLHLSSTFNPKLSLVAKVKDRIVGVILFTEISIGAIKSTTHQVLGLAPLAVLPNFQKQGIGKALIEKGHLIAKNIGYCASIVLGDNNYYERFGYKTSTAYNIHSPFDVPEKFFMIKELIIGEIKNMTGIVIYPKEFTET